MCVCKYRRETARKRQCIIALGDSLYSRLSSSLEYKYTPGNPNSCAFLACLLPSLGSFSKKKKRRRKIVTLHFARARNIRLQIEFRASQTSSLRRRDKSYIRFRSGEFPGRIRLSLSGRRRRLLRQLFDGTISDRAHREAYRPV